MEGYPEKTCDISRLLSHPMLVKAALAGNKTQQRRNGIYAYPDEEFELEGTLFRLVSLERQKLGDMTNACAQAEGFPSLEAYKGLILRMHKNMQWNEDDQVWVHTFQKA